MADITLIFDVTKGGPSKDHALNIAERQEIHKEKDKIRVVFHKPNPDLLTLLEICKQWKSSVLLIDNNECRFPEVLKILKCTDKNYCEGFCRKGNGLDFGIKTEIENASKGVYGEFSDPESVKHELAQTKGIKKEKDGLYYIDKNDLKRNLLIDYNLPLQVCEKIDREAMIKYNDACLILSKFLMTLLMLKRNLKGFLTTKCRIPGAGKCHGTDHCDTSLEKSIKYLSQIWALKKMQFPVREKPIAFLN